MIENNINNTFIVNNSETQLPILDIEHCELLLKKVYNISLEEELIVIKKISQLNFINI